MVMYLLRKCQQSFRTILRTHQRSVFSVILLIFVLFLWFEAGKLTSYSTYLRQVIQVMSWDEVRNGLKEGIAAEDEWRLHLLNMKYYKNECAAEHNNPKHAWITALNNDKYAIPTLVLGYMLERMSCIRTKIALVSDQVTPLGKMALEAVGFQVRVTEGLDCNYMDMIYNREMRNKGISGTHTRLLVFNMTEYDKLIYLDSDYFPISPLDSLFDMVLPRKVLASYCAAPSQIDPCFNAGLVGLVPDTPLYYDIMAMWKDKSAVDCPDDQRLLWWFFADRNNWIPLSFSFNVRRKRYFPMRSFHFARSESDPRPWEWTSRPSDEELLSFNGPLHTVSDIIKLWWKYLLTVIEEKELGEFWGSVAPMLR